MPLALIREARQQAADASVHALQWGDLYSAVFFFDFEALAAERAARR